MNYTFGPKKQFLFFLLLFFVVNFIQSCTTGLLDDEYYYWVWSKELAFGYFDHPPLVALWIKISDFLFNGELGVRFFSNVSFLLMIFFIWKSIDNQKKWQYVWLFFLLVASASLLNVYGFVTTPDTPLLLFVAVFLYGYKRFLATNSIESTLLLGFAMAGMLYSKYPGILIIFFLLLSNISLLKNKKFWWATTFGILLFSPHILWQITHDFPSVKYHLLERSNMFYQPKYTLMYFVNLIAIIGLPFPIIYFAFFKQKAANLFEKGLKYIVFGFVVFFFLSTFRTSTQAQWNAPILIPIIILTFGYFVRNMKGRKWLVYLGLVNLVLLMMARVLLANETLSPIQLETHGAKQWAENIRLKTKDRPIVFKSSYQRASKYYFLTGIKTHSVSTIKTRKSQYDLSNFEKTMQHRDVTIVSDSIQGYFIYQQKKHIFYGEDVDDYGSFQKVECFIKKDSLSFYLGQQNSFKFEISNPYDRSINSNGVQFIGVFQGEKNKVLKEIPLKIYENFEIRPHENKELLASIKIPPDIQSNVLTFRVALRFYQLPSGYQGNKVALRFIVP